MLDLTGRVLKTNEMISNVDLINQLSAEVWKGTTWTIQSHQIVVAMKVMRPLLFLDREIKEQSSQRLLREVETLDRSIHPNVVPFIGISNEVDSVRNMRVPCLITPFYMNGSIMEYLANNSDAVRMDLLRPFFAGLTYLHSQSIVHGNIKSTNILIDDDGKAMLADYGLSPFPPNNHCQTEISGSLLMRYLAPELISPGRHDTPTAQSDVWAAGMTGLEILTGNIPYVQYRSDSEWVRAMARRKIPKKQHYPSVRHGAWSAFLHCWKWNPSERPTTQRLSEPQYDDRTRRHSANCISEETLVTVT